jgi:hypothetical protein
MLLLHELVRRRRRRRMGIIHGIIWREHREWGWAHRVWGQRKLRPG